MLALAAHPTSGHPAPSPFVDGLCKGLKTFDEMLSGQSARKLERGQHLFHQGDDDRNIYKIESGLVRLYRILNDGRRQIISLRFAGDVLGFEAGSERHYSAEAITPVRVRSLDENSTYRRLRDEPALAPQLVSLLSQELENAREQIAVLNRRSAIEKLAAFILELHRRQGECGTVEIPLSRTDIADFLGLTIETVSRNLTKLRTRRIIDLPRIHSLVIVDFERLEALAEGEGEDW
ncbi:helix-turn-helix domain-containing protein [Taklimakanibacter deserti]|uniref:helix-turn-helix domain-containing protein n=1 Tax=Taklimakanibacter deserti TaxID=2267839 RepID=UPI000E65B80E